MHEIPRIRLTLASIIFIYALTTGSLHGTVSIYVYLVSPLARKLDMLMLTVMYPFVSTWEFRSSELLDRHCNQAAVVARGTTHGESAPWKNWGPWGEYDSSLAMLILLRGLLTRECVEQVSNPVLLYSDFDCRAPDDWGKSILAKIRVWGQVNNAVTVYGSTRHRPDSAIRKWYLFCPCSRECPSFMQ